MHALICRVKAVGDCVVNASFLGAGLDASGFLWTFRHSDWLAGSLTASDCLADGLGTRVRECESLYSNKKVRNRERLRVSWRV